jgi:hypothetical protein
MFENEEIHSKMDDEMAYSETEDEERERFLVELEFVQCLASPVYLNCKW